MSTLKRLLGCLGSQGREGHLQEALCLAHGRITPLEYSAVTRHYLAFSKDWSNQFITGAFLLWLFLDTYVLSADIHYFTWSCTISSGSVLTLVGPKGDLPPQAAEPGLGSAASLQLQVAQTRQPAAKPQPPQTVTALQLMLFRGAE